MFGMFFALLSIAVLSTPALADRKKGVVKWYNAQKGMGFLTIDEHTPEIFVPASALSKSCNGTLHEGQAVEFDLVNYNGGNASVPVTKQKAANVTCR
jgi:CspA family cold shock protein